MIQKFKMTTFAAVLCLFGFSLFSASPVYADTMTSSQFVSEFKRCKSIKNNSLKRLEKLMNCYATLAIHAQSDGVYSPHLESKDQYMNDSNGHTRAAGAYCIGKMKTRGGMRPDGEDMRQVSKRSLMRCLKDYYGAISRVHYDFVK